MAHILILGASGLIGQRLAQALVMRGDKVSVVSRAATQAQLAFPCQVILWEEQGRLLPDHALDEVDVVVNLAGESIAEGRWTADKKQRLLDSRLTPSQAMVQAILRTSKKPKAVIQASAIGYYAGGGDTELGEDSPSGTHFAGQLCQKWEQATAKLLDHDVRVAHIRIGVVLAHAGGALAKLAPLYQRGLGAVLGHGRQWFSWIHIEDIVRLFLFAIDNPRVQGSINGSAPNPCRLLDLHRLLKGRATGPDLKIPALALRAALGEASELLLDSVRVMPQRALELGFQFRFPEIESALSDLYGGPALLRSAWFCHDQWLPAPLAEVARFFADASNLEKLTPPWLNFSIVSMSTPEVMQNTKIHYRLKIHGLPLAWTTEISTWDPPHRFVDEQVQGPFALWHHTHSFTALGTGTLMRDLVRYRPPLGKLGALAGGWLVDLDVKRIFKYRQKVISRLFPL